MASDLVCLKCGRRYYTAATDEPTLGRVHCDEPCGEPLFTALTPRPDDERELDGAPS